MSIWVRSQDKLCLMRIDALPIINHDEGERIWSIIGIGKFQYKLGTYESESRTIEVLDEIQKLLIALPRTEIPFNDIVYQMPKE